MCSSIEELGAALVSMALLARGVGAVCTSVSSVVRWDCALHGRGGAFISEPIPELSYGNILAGRLAGWLVF
jgi:hypothetical protein